MEFNGWLIPASGRQIDGVFTVVAGKRSQLQPLHVARPDVLTDYPTAAATCPGFSFWCAIPADLANARVQLVSQFSTGEMVPLLDLQVSMEHGVAHEVDESTRSVSAPDFVIIGTQRGGTTSLHAYLQAHPNIQTPAKKELHFLTDRYERGAAWYLGQFPALVPTGTLVGEATPYALYHPLAPRRLAEVAPNARVIVLLRNPVDRAYSHYLHERSRGHEDLSFEAAIAAEPARLEGLEQQLAVGELMTSDMHKRASYAARGRYAQQLDRWLSVFPREQMLIVRSEDLYGDPAATTERVTDFLGLLPLKDDSFSAHNTTAGPPLLASTRVNLEREFALDNERLAERLGWGSTWD